MYWAVLGGTDSRVGRNLLPINQKGASGKTAGSAPAGGADIMIAPKF
jgi:hypothetical protein